MNNKNSNYFLRHTEDIYNSDNDITEENKDYSLSGSGEVKSLNKEKTNPFSNMMSNINSNNNSKGFANRVVNDLFGTENDLNDSKDKNSYEYKESPAFSK